MKRLIKRNIKKRRVMAGLLSASPSLALADSSGFKLDSILSALISLLNGDIARVIFILGIIGVGYGWLGKGVIPKNRAIGVIAGIGVVFSASYIAQQLGVGS